MFAHVLLFNKQMYVFVAVLCYLCVPPLIPLRTFETVTSLLMAILHLADTESMISCLHCCSSGDTLALVCHSRTVYLLWSRWNFGSRVVMTACYVDRLHTLSSHSFCDSVAQSGASQKKTLHHGAHTLLRSLLIPL